MLRESNLLAAFDRGGCGLSFAKPLRENIALQSISLRSVLTSRDAWEFGRARWERRESRRRRHRRGSTWTCSLAGGSTENVREFRMTLFPSFSIQGVEGSPDNTTFAFLPKSKKDLLILKLTGQYDLYQGLINPRGCHIIWDVLHKLSRLRPTRI